MRIAHVLGSVTLSRCHPSFVGASLRLAVPMSREDLAQDRVPQAEPLVLWDQWGAAVGSRILLSEGPEAAQPFRPAEKPVDAYNAGILDEIHLRSDL